MHMTGSMCDPRTFLLSGCLERQSTQSSLASMHCRNVLTLGIGFSPILSLWETISLAGQRRSPPKQTSLWACDILVITINSVIEKNTTRAGERICEELFIQLIFASFPLWIIPKWIGIFPNVFIVQNNLSTLFSAVYRQNFLQETSGVQGEPVICYTPWECAAYSPRGSGTTS